MAEPQVPKSWSSICRHSSLSPTRGKLGQQLVGCGVLWAHAPCPPQPGQTSFLSCPQWLLRGQQKTQEKESSCQPALSSSSTPFLPASSLRPSFPGALFFPSSPHLLRFSLDLAPAVSALAPPSEVLPVGGRHSGIVSLGKHLMPIWGWGATMSPTHSHCVCVCVLPQAPHSTCSCTPAPGVSGTGPSFLEVIEAKWLREDGRPGRAVNSPSLPLLLSNPLWALDPPWEAPSDLSRGLSGHGSLA